jgi:K+ transporter
MARGLAGPAGADQPQAASVARHAAAGGGRFAGNGAVLCRLDADARDLGAVGGRGLGVVSHAFHPFIVPISLAILVGLFMIQSHGTERVGQMFGPVMIVYFLSIAAMGLWNIRLHAQVLWEPLNPTYIWYFFEAHPYLSFVSLAAVVYSITGVEALYADMGHFGRKAITWAWALVFPCLVLNYMGQAALLISDPASSSNPFFNMVPDSLQLPLVVLATLATVIASQAVISGAYSVTHQAIQLGYLPVSRSSTPRTPWLARSIFRRSTGSWPAWWRCWC